MGLDSNLRILSWQILDQSNISGGGGDVTISGADAREIIEDIMYDALTAGDNILITYDDIPDPGIIRIGTTSSITVENLTASGIGTFGGSTQIATTGSGIDVIHFTEGVGGILCTDFTVSGTEHKVYNAGQWVSYMGTDYWDDSLSGGITWNAGLGQYDVSGSFNLYATGDWPTAFRPTKLRLTISGSPSGYLDLYVNDVFQTDIGYGADFAGGVVEIAPDENGDYGWNGADFDNFQYAVDGGIAITNIEFFTTHYSLESAWNTLLDVHANSVRLGDSSIIRESAFTYSSSALTGLTLSSPVMMYNDDDNEAMMWINKGIGNNLFFMGAKNYLNKGYPDDTFTGYNNMIFTHGGFLNQLTSANHNIILDTGVNHHYLTTGLRNVFIGQGASGRVTTGDNNVFIGNYIGQDSADYAANSNQNIGIGYEIFHDQQGQNMGTYNIAMGYQAGWSIDGTGNIAIGYQAAKFGYSDNYLVNIGYGAGSNSTGPYSVYLGYFAGNSAYGTDNVAIGRQALYTSNSSTYNVVIGYQAGYSPGASSCVAIGREAGYYLRAQSTYIGAYAGRQNTGTSITTIGYYAGYNGDGSNNVFIGDYAGYQYSGSDSVIIGKYAGYTSGSTQNVNIGYDASRYNTGDFSVTIGYRAGYNGDGSYNVFIGHQAGYSNTGSNQVCIGYYAGSQSGAGENVCIGHYAHYANSGDYNIAIGREAGYSGGGSYNVFMGYGAAYGNSSSQSIAIGYYAARNADGNNTVSIGYYAGYDRTSTDSVFIGHEAGYVYEPEGSVVIGRRAGYNNSGGSGYNVVIGYFAGYQMSTGGYNVIIGREAIGNATAAEGSQYIGYRAGYEAAGDYNAALGHQAGYSNTGNNSVFVGAYAGYSGNGSENVFVGYNAGHDNTASYNVMIGRDAGYSSSAAQSVVSIGYRAGYRSGSNCVFIGRDAGYNYRGKDTTAVGSYAAYGKGGKTSGAQYNTFFGHYAGYDIYSGVHNTALGRQAGQNISSGSYNTFVGNSAGSNISTGTNNVFIGYSAGGNVTTSGIGNVFIGFNAGYNATGSNKLYIANTNTVTPLIYGEFDTPFLSLNSEVFVGGAVTIDGDLEIWGNLTVSGTVSGSVTRIDTQELQVSDNIITLNYDWPMIPPTESAGIEIERGTLTDSRILWDEVADLWKAGLAGSEVEISLLGHTHSEYLNKDGSVQLTGDWGFGSFTISGTGDIYGGDLYAAGNADIYGHMAIGNDAAIDFPGFPTYEILCNMQENFDASIVGAYGLQLYARGAADNAGAVVRGISATAIHDSSGQFNTLRGVYGAAYTADYDAVGNNIQGIYGSAYIGQNNATVTNLIGGYFTAGAVSSMVTATGTNVVAGQFRALATGSGDFNVVDTYGVQILTPGATYNGTLTNLYGLYIEDMTASSMTFSNEYNIYSAGIGSKNYFEGDIYCNDIYTSSGTVYIGDAQITSAAGVLNFGGAVTIDGDILPTASGISSIGGETLPYVQVYLADQATGDVYGVTIVSGTLIATLV